MSRRPSQDGHDPHHHHLPRWFRQSGSRKPSQKPSVKTAARRPNPRAATGIAIQALSDKNRAHTLRPTKAPSAAPKIKCTAARPHSKGRPFGMTTILRSWLSPRVYSRSIPATNSNLPPVFVTPAQPPITQFPGKRADSCAATPTKGPKVCHGVPRCAISRHQPASFWRRER